MATSRSGSPLAMAPSGWPARTRAGCTVAASCCGSIPPPGGRPGGFATRVWTGSRIVLLAWGAEWFDGGEVDPWPERVYTNGVYDPATDSWSRPAARPASLQPGYGGRFVWTGREVLLWGLGGGVGYDPAADTWRAMAKAPFTREFASAAWTGAELLVWGGTTGQDCVDGCPRADGLAYRPGVG
jgi:hypothetical protein